MKNIKNWNDFLNENSNPSPEELKQFYKDLMAGKTQLQQHHKNYKVDVNKVIEMVQSIVYTPEFLAELKRRKIQIPDVNKMKMRVEKEQYHRHFKYALTDSPLDPDKERFVISVTIEVPYDESFEDDNTMITASIYVKKHGRLRELFGYSNKRAQKDNEFNMYGMGSVIQNAYQEAIQKIN